MALELRSRRVFCKLDHSDRYLLLRPSNYLGKVRRCSPDLISTSMMSLRKTCHLVKRAHPCINASSNKNLRQIGKTRSLRRKRPSSSNPPAISQVTMTAVLVCRVIRASQTMMELSRPRLVHRFAVKKIPVRKSQSLLAKSATRPPWHLKKTMSVLWGPSH